MMQINASTVTQAVVLAFILTFTCAATLRADSTTPSSIPSPLQVVGLPQGNGIAVLSLDHDAYADMKRLQAFDIADFPLNGDRRVDLRVRQIDVFSADGKLVLGSGEGDQPLARPDVILLSGEVVGAPGSIVFLGLSPHGTHGYIQFPDELFIISTRAGNTVIYSLAAIPEGLLTFPDFQCDVIDVANRIGADDTRRNQTASGVSAQCRVVDIAIDTPPRSRGPSWFRHARSRSGWCARHARSATRGSHIACRRITCCPIDSRRCWRCCTSSSTRGTRRRQATTWFARTCHARQFAWRPFGG